MCYQSEKLIIINCVLILFYFNENIFFVQFGFNSILSRLLIINIERYMCFFFYSLMKTFSKLLYEVRSEISCQLSTQNSKFNESFVSILGFGNGNSFK